MREQVSNVGVVNQLILFSLLLTRFARDTATSAVETQFYPLAKLNYKMIVNPAASKIRWRFFRVKKVRPDVITR